MLLESVKEDIRDRISEFYEIDKHVYAASGDRKDLTFINCIEIMLSEELKSVWIKRDEETLIMEHSP